MSALKRIIATMLTVLILGTLSACSSSEPCDSCGRTPTKAYKNEHSGEKEYYCERCSSDCAFCPHKATMHYTSSAGIIIFICEDCYDEYIR